MPTHRSSTIPIRIHSIPILALIQGNSLSSGSSAVSSTAPTSVPQEAGGGDEPTEEDFGEECCESEAEDDDPIVNPEVHHWLNIPAKMNS